MTALLESIDLLVLCFRVECAPNAELHPAFPLIINLINSLIIYYSYKSALGIGHSIVCFLYCIIKKIDRDKKGLGGALPHFATPQWCYDYHSY